LELKCLVAPVGALLSALNMLTVTLCALRSIDDMSSNICDLFALRMS
jgi:hypothetical protein